MKKKKRFLSLFICLFYVVTCLISPISVDASTPNYNVTVAVGDPSGNVSMTAGETLTFGVYDYSMVPTMLKASGYNSDFLDVRISDKGVKSDYHEYSVSLVAKKPYFAQVTLSLQANPNIAGWSKNLYVCVGSAPETPAPTATPTAKPTNTPSIKYYITAYGNQGKFSDGNGNYYSNFTSLSNEIVLPIPKADGWTFTKYQVTSGKANIDYTYNTSGEIVSAKVKPLELSEMVLRSVFTVKATPTPTVNPSASPRVTSTPKVTATPRVTSTPKVTATPRVTSTPTPTPVPTEEPEVVKSITLNANQGVYSNGDSVNKLNYGELDLNTPIKVEVPSYNGYKFTGYKLVSGLAYVKYDTGSDGSIESARVTPLDFNDIILIASYVKDAVEPEPSVKPDNITVTLDANGGTYGGSSTLSLSTYKAGEYFELTSGLVPTREGYTFEGWVSNIATTNISKSGASSYSVVCYEDATLYAQWKEIVKPTETPVITSTPVVTETPSVTSTPIATSTPVVTSTPNVTTSPSVTATPDPLANSKVKNEAKLLTDVASSTVTQGCKSFKIAVLRDGDGAISYKSSNTNVATVSDNGTISVKNPGVVTITVTVAETEKYKGATKSFKITVKPKTVKVSSVKAGSKKATVKINKVSGASYYMVQVSTSKNFSKPKTYKISSKSSSKVISKLKKGKKYYFRVCACKTSGQSVLKSKWSTVKSVKVK